MHECEKCKSNKMQDCLVDKAGRFYCRSCIQLLDNKDVHSEIIKKFGRPKDER